ncbi:MAG: DUF1566 domain-containing protein [Deltaproteobacteria bacterium]|nr:DUF1566 domain-containing protein [Deltaproteobacteria bacterium]
MGMFQRLSMSDSTIKTIDWGMTPDLSFGTFESWGGRERVRNNSERICYFFIDNWGKEPKLCLMERGVKHARILAEISAPVEMVKECVRQQGSSSAFEKSYAINGAIKEWLIDNVVEAQGDAYVKPVYVVKAVEDMGTLPLPGVHPFTGERCVLPAESAVINDDQIEPLIKKWNFFDSILNPLGRFDNALVDNGDGLTVTDERTGVMWQRAGLDIASSRTLRRNIEKLNSEGFAGFHDWRLPTIEEALSLMEPVMNTKGLYLHPCFSREQPFIFVAAQRKPGGYWFVDYKQGRAFWSSGTIPGAFGRLCRR